MNYEQSINRQLTRFAAPPPKSSAASVKRTLSFDDCTIAFYSPLID